MDARLMLLVDGSSYLYRAYHAMPDLRSPDGFPTGAIHGVVAMMQWLRERYPAEHAVCVFDAQGNVVNQLTIQPIANVAAGDKLAILASKR